MSADLAPTPAGVWPDCPHHPGASHLQAHPKGWGWVCPVRRAEGLWTQQPVDATWQSIEPVGRVRSSAFDLPGPTSLPRAPGEQPAQPETAAPPATTATIPLTILATGGRRWAHFERLCKTLDQAAGEARGPVRLIVGDCPTGADQQARIWAKRRGVPVEVHRARWDEMAAEGKPRKAAGTLRNLAMLDALDQAGGDRKVLAFHDDLARSRGTRHCVHQARQRGYTVALVARQRVEILGREGRAEPGALRAAALEYARRGIPVVPLHYPVERQHKDQPPTVGCSCRAPDCQRIGKHPIGALTPHGVKDATTDSAVIAYWWQRYPQANIGLATGARFDVLDVDGRRGAAWLRRYAAKHGIRLAGPLAQSGSGGWHYYFAATGRACPPLRDPASGEAIAQVDWRGNGGVIVAPPSRHASGQSYRWVRDLDTPLPEVPAPLRTLLEPSAGRAARPTAPAPARAAGRNHPYARSALEGECARVAGTPLGSGRRNKTLYAASLRLHSYVAGGLLDEGEVQRHLLEAARVCGLPQREASATIRSAATVARVKGVPERPPPPPQRRHPGRDPPQAKETRARWRRADRERDSIP